MAEFESSVEELQHLALLLEKERNVAKDQYEQSIQNSSQQERINNGVCWAPLELVEVGFGLGQYPFAVFKRTKNQHKPHRFTPGSFVRLSNEDEFIDGTVQYVNKDQLKVIFTVNDLPYWIEKSKLQLLLLFDDYSFNEMQFCLKKLIKEPELAKFRDQILGYQASVNGSAKSSYQSQLLNSSQNAAVGEILANNIVSIVHGPPGTGKTTTLVEAVMATLKQEKRVLVCAPSNAAVDHFSKKLAAKGLKVLRVGNLAKVDDTMLPFTLDYQLANHPQARQLKKLRQQANEYRQMAAKYKRSFGPEERRQRKLLYQEATSISKDIVETEDYLVEQLLDSSQVIACTLVGAAHKLMRKEKFDTVFIDEAAQALEPACWIPMLKANKVVLAGDHYQLPPTVLSMHENKGLTISLMEKLVERSHPSILLNTQYRMNKQIMGYSNNYFYGGKLVAHETVSDQLLAGPNNDPVEFIDTAGCSLDEERNDNSMSIFNKGEIDLLIKHLQMNEESYSGKRIGIISPYKEQVISLNETLSTLQIEDLSCNTIDAFQGQECDVIYISMVRSNESGEIGFLADLRRMNVAMTRARYKLVIIGNSATLGSNPFYSNLLNYTEEINAYRSAWEYMY